MSGLSMIGASGSVAAPAFDTRAAPKRPAAEARMKFLRVVIAEVLSARGRARRKRHLQVGFSDPEVALRFEIRVDARHGVARVGEQLEYRRQHAVVAQQHLLRDALPERHDLVAVMPRDVERRAVGGVGLPYLGAGADRAIRGTVDRLCVPTLAR